MVVGNVVNTYEIKSKQISLMGHLQESLCKLQCVNYCGASQTGDAGRARVSYRVQLLIVFVVLFCGCRARVSYRVQLLIVFVVLFCGCPLPFYFLLG